MQAKLAAAKEKFGREIRVFETLTGSPTSDVSNSEEPDDLYDFTAEDYYRILATKKEDKFLKTQKIREMEEAAQRSRITKAVIRIRFPDNHTLEVSFHPSETIQILVDLLMKVVAQPELPFFLYTTPPKKEIKDTSLDFYSAGFVPGAIVYFSYDMLKGCSSLLQYGFSVYCLTYFMVTTNAQWFDLSMATSLPGDDSAAASGPFLREEVMSLKGLELIAEQAEPAQSAPEPEIASTSSSVQERKPANKKTVKPKWLKM
ncbi:unnamed protein product [Ilex paraguariensis]|uniref:UBX domain-containing protein n=1 Tax=Ilex paraguariensis TaxID=185542 RepID=A0ABC8SXS8_9AQUA